ncbi:MAG TPA: tetratricopeptide repeat protein, partial [Kofleriaceae bacterium]|nr:tetratricopeptide repeat protein [Kofleriaceae bacterium]
LGFVGTMPVPPTPAQPPPRPAMPIPQNMRQSTPIPAEVRAATNQAKFNITGDLPALPASARMTGAMPLVDEQSLSGVDFALPEYDDSDFSADMEPPPDPRTMSAAGERHAEEISKILAETDVYVKYGLHQKAIDHLRRVFTLDADNVEARERLKDIFVSQGREQEAEAELLRLAEVVAPSDPDRAEAYLQELLAMNGTHTGAFELARRFRLRVARMSSISAEVELSADYGGVSIVDSELDDIDLVSPPRGMSGAPARPQNRDSIDDFDPGELIGDQMAHGSPAPGRPPQPPNGDYAGETEFDLDFEPSPSQATRQMAPEVVEALTAQREDDHPMIVDRPPVRWAESLEDAQALDAQLDDAELGDDIDRQVATELAAQDLEEDLPFDPDEARAFDAAVPKVPQVASETDATYVPRFDDNDVPVSGPASTIDSSGFEVADDAMNSSGSYDAAAFADPTAHNTVASGPPGFSSADLEHASPARADSNMEDDLDEAEFYASQGMYAEAIDVLNGLSERFPGHRLVLSKLREVEALAAGGGLEGDSIDPLGGHTAGSTDALDLDEIEEMGVEHLVELGDDSEPVSIPRKRQPTVMLEKPLDDGDSVTHYDLGLAYKEMALYDDAIKSFEKVLRAPGREVQCRVMMGMCLREQGNPSEAIHQFKQGLHAEPTERERQSLYYEIGITYETIGDDSEALYYLEMVLKRDPHFADAALRAEALRAHGGRAMHAPDDDL